MNRGEIWSAAAGNGYAGTPRPVVIVRRAPLAGTLRFSYELAIPELRAVPLDRFPYLIFYVAGDDRVLTPAVTRAS